MGHFNQTPRDHEKIDLLNELELSMRKYVPDTKLIRKILYNRDLHGKPKQNLDIVKLSDTNNIDHLS